MYANGCSPTTPWCASGSDLKESVAEPALRHDWRRPRNPFEPKSGNSARKEIRFLVTLRQCPVPCGRHYRGTIPSMKLARSRITAQGQLSVPVEVRRKLGIGPGSVLEWREEGEAIVVRRSGQFTSDDIHHALFKKPPKSRTIEELKEGIRKSVRERHARR